MNSSAAEKALEEKIERLESRVAILQAELERTRKATLGEILGALRLRQIILMYVGTEDAAALVDSLQKDFGNWEINQAIRHLFVLNNAPCGDEQREQFRAILNNGMVKF